MKRRSLVVLICVSSLFSASAAFAHAPAGVPTSGPYSVARKKLLWNGWRPVHQPEPGFKCLPGDRRCKGRPETVVCAGTGLANCIFRWRRAGTVVDVLTVGETPQISGVRCRKGCRY